MNNLATSVKHLEKTVRNIIKKVKKIKFYGILFLEYNNFFSELT